VIAVCTRSQPPFPWREAVALVGFALLVAHCAGCAPSAESAYGAALLRCVDKATTLADSRACRRDVDAKWGVDGGQR
jgi:hypothetical protein